MMQPGQTVELPSGKRGVVYTEPLRGVRWADGSYTYPLEKHLIPVEPCGFCEGVGTVCVTCPMCHGRKVI